MLLHHGHLAPESLATNVCPDALHISRISRVCLPAPRRVDGPLRKASFSAPMRALMLTEQEELIGALLQDFKSGSQAQSLFLLCLAAARRQTHMNREGIMQAILNRCGDTPSWRLIVGCLAIGTMLDMCSAPEPAHTCSCHAAAPT